MFPIFRKISFQIRAFYFWQNAIFEKNFKIFPFFGLVLITCSPNSTMLVLDEVRSPMGETVIVQPQVVTYWDKDCLGQGTLYLTTSTVVWICNSTRRGFILTYPAISVHAMASSNEDFPDPCLFLVIDVKKTDIQYSPEMDVEEEDDGIDPMTATIRFIPADSAVVLSLYEKMNEYQAQNPEPDDEINMNGSDEEEFEEGDGDGDEVLYGNTGRWYTSETAGDEIYLSAEGRANLERMVGNLNDIQDESNQLTLPPTNNGASQNGDEMDED